MTLSDPLMTSIEMSVAYERLRESCHAIHHLTWKAELTKYEVNHKWSIDKHLVGGSFGDS